MKEELKKGEGVVTEKCRFCTCLFKDWVDGVMGYFSIYNNACLAAALSPLPLLFPPPSHFLILPLLLPDNKLWYLFGLLLTDSLQRVLLKEGSNKPKFSKNSIDCQSPNSWELISAIILGNRNDSFCWTLCSQLLMMRTRLYLALYMKPLARNVSMISCLCIDFIFKVWFQVQDFPFYLHSSFEHFYKVIIILLHK